MPGTRDLGIIQLCVQGAWRAAVPHGEVDLDLVFALGQSPSLRTIQRSECDSSEAARVPQTEQRPTNTYKLIRPLSNFLTRPCSKTIIKDGKRLKNC